jgi:hypothetical protein
MKHPLTPAQDRELLDHIQALDDVISITSNPLGHSETDVLLTPKEADFIARAVTRAAEFLVNLRE